MPTTPAAAIGELIAGSPSTTTQRQPYREAIGLLIALLGLIGQNAVAFSGTLVAPLMGITSVLWLMMRNDAAIEPRVSWMMFGAWSVLTLTYLMIQCRRVANHGRYILLVVMTASTCMCLVASVQKSSLQSGIVTAIPTCTSIAAYAVAYFFPDRHAANVDPWYTPV